MARFFHIIVSFLLFLGPSLFSWGCEKMEEVPKESKTAQDAPVSPAQPMPQNHPPISPGMSSPIAPIRGDNPAVVPDNVKGKWKAVRLKIEDKKEKVSQEVEVDLHTEWTLPDSDLVLRVGEFLPDLKIEGSTFTSVSNELNNPAVHLTIFEEGKPIFNGWLFSMFPTIHPFQHERYRILLKEAVQTG